MKSEQTKKELSEKQLANKHRIWRKVLVGVTTVVAIALFIVWSVTPRKDTIDTSDLPASYMITSEHNFVEYQTGRDCAGYASAYVLRHLGEEIEGRYLYKEMSFKVGNGVALGGVRKVFADRGYDASSYTGTIDTLKKRVSMGIPVVAFVTIGEEGLHYVAIVGYDEEYIYMADSTGYSKNIYQNNLMNRKLTYEEFEAIWQTNIYPVNNIYTVINS